MTVVDDLGGRLRRIRESRNLSIYEVERRTGLHFSTISKYERNERQPSLDALRELAALYQVPVTAFLADELDLEAVLPPRLAALARQLLDRPALVEACERLAALDDRQILALTEFLDRIGLTRRGRGAAGGPQRSRGAAYPRPRPSAPSAPGTVGPDDAPASAAGTSAAAAPGDGGHRPTEADGGGKAVPDGEAGYDERHDGPGAADGDRAGRAGR
ncbi:MAG TPA: helix-turn-helix transcriptional regulator [Thermaerobacter sp.]